MPASFERLVSQDRFEWTASPLRFVDRLSVVDQRELLERGGFLGEAERDVLLDPDNPVKIFS